MFTITYQDKHYRRWSDDFVFTEYQQAKDHLYNKGFAQSNGIYTRGKFNWCDGLNAYIEPKKIYK